MRERLDHASSRIEKTTQILRFDRLFLASLLMALMACSIQVQTRQPVRRKRERPQHAAPQNPTIRLRESNGALRPDEFERFDEAVAQGDNPSPQDRAAGSAYRNSQENTRTRRWSGLRFEIEILEDEFIQLEDEIQKARSEREKNVLKTRRRTIRDRISSLLLEQERLGV